MPLPVSATRIETRRRRGVDRNTRRTAGGLAVDRLPRVDQQVHERQPQPLGVGRDDRQRRIEVERTDGPGAARAAARIAAQRVDVGRRELNWIGRAKSSTSLTIRFSRRPPVDVGRRFAHRVGARSRCRSVWSAALMIISGLRTLVRDDRRQPSERRQPFLLRHLALKPRDRIGQRVEGVASSAASSSSRSPRRRSSW
jgi:hypothetical protein